MNFRKYFEGTSSGDIAQGPAETPKHKKNDKTCKDSKQSISCGWQYFTEPINKGQ